MKGQCQFWVPVIDLFLGIDYSADFYWTDANNDIRLLDYEN